MAKGSPLFDCINNTAESNRTKCMVVAALVSRCCFIVAAAVIVLGFGALFMFVCSNARP